MINSEDKTQDVIDDMIRSDMPAELAAFFSITDPVFFAVYSNECMAFSELYNLTQRHMPAGFSVADMMNCTLQASNIKYRYDLYAFLTKYTILHMINTRTLLYRSTAPDREVEELQEKVDRFGPHRYFYGLALAIEFARELHREANDSLVGSYHPDNNPSVLAERGYRWMGAIFDRVPNQNLAVQYAQIAARVFQIKATKKDAPNFTKALLA